MPARNDPATGLGDLETSVMEALWEHGELGTPEVHNLVGRPRSLAYTTILTILQRLYKKGLVVRREAGRLHVYAAANSREQFAKQRGEVLASSFVELGSAGVMAFLAEAQKLDPAIVDLLRARLDSQA
jgi:predicted transcriptional regulator